MLSTRSAEEEELGTPVLSTRSAEEEEVQEESEASGTRETTEPRRWWAERSSWETVMRRAQVEFLAELTAQREAFMLEALGGSASAEEEEAKPRRVTPKFLEQIGAEVSLADTEHCEDRCSVCLNDYEELDPIATLGCGHTFHKTCISQWLHVKKNCPLCRTKVVPSW